MLFPTAVALTHFHAGERVVASPYARKLAAEAGLSLEGLAGSGPEGRIVAEDVHKAVAAGKVSSITFMSDCPVAGSIGAEREKGTSSAFSIRAEWRTWLCLAC